AGYTNATAFFSSKLIVDNKGGSIYVCSEAEYGEQKHGFRIPLRCIRATLCLKKLSLKNDE
ncbi:hypothetical protein, partial [Coxiella burnetii]|uniref:hypothetical protein n=1 Tax=Coxiella burnetii TaxID=777 RepID=UPI001EE43D1B